MTKRVAFMGVGPYKCVICGKSDNKLDMLHVLHEGTEEITYGGITFHKTCFSFEQAMRNARARYRSKTEMR